MRAGAFGAAVLLVSAAAAADPGSAPHPAPSAAPALSPSSELIGPALSPVDQCLACHIAPSGALDIVGLEALESLPAEWSLIYEDAFDLDGDGIAGAVRFVSGPDRPLAAKYGRALAAARFEDFAMIAGAAHGVAVSEPDVMAAIKAAFEARSPKPDLPFANAAAQQRFEARGCAACHVTRRFEHDGRAYMPLSDFLLHDLGDGPRRTAPLWGCPDCLDAPPHPGATLAD